MREVIGSTIHGDYGKGKETHVAFTLNCSLPWQ